MPPSGAGARARTLARTLALLALLVLSPRLASAEPLGARRGDRRAPGPEFLGPGRESAGRGAHGPSGAPGHRARAPGRRTGRPQRPLQSRPDREPPQVRARTAGRRRPPDRLRRRGEAGRLPDRGRRRDRGSPARGAGRRGRVRPPARQPRHGGWRRDRAPGRAGLGRHPRAGRDGARHGRGDRGRSSDASSHRRSSRRCAPSPLRSRARWKRSAGDSRVSSGCSSRSPCSASGW